jgi:hypothetical protein
MPVSRVSASSHRTGILMSDAGRFVSCIDCHRGFTFPDKDGLRENCELQLDKVGVEVGVTTRPPEWPVLLPPSR